MSFLFCKEGRPPAKYEGKGKQDKMIALDRPDKMSLKDVVSRLCAAVCAAVEGGKAAVHVMILGCFGEAYVEPLLKEAREKWLPLLEDEDYAFDGERANKWMKDKYNRRIVWGVGRQGKAHRSLTRRGISKYFMIMVIQVIL